MITKTFSDPKKNITCERLASVLLIKKRCISRALHEQFQTQLDHQRKIT